MLPLAPARFSTTMRCPSTFETPSAMMRVTPSAHPPGELGTTQRIDFEGNGCADAAPARAQMQATKASLTAFIRILLLLCVRHGIATHANHRVVGVRRCGSSRRRPFLSLRAFCFEPETARGP